MYFWKFSNLIHGLDWYLLFLKTLFTLRITNTKQKVHINFLGSGTFSRAGVLKEWSFYLQFTPPSLVLCRVNRFWCCHEVKESSVRAESARIRANFVPTLKREKRVRTSKNRECSVFSSPWGLLFRGLILKKDSTHKTSAMGS